MKKAYFRLYKAILLTSGIAFFASCDKDVNTIGTDIIGDGNFETDRAEFDVYAYNRKLNAAQTNGLSLYQLGVFNDPIYGKTEAGIVSQLYLNNTNPTFGLASQGREEEYANDNDNSTTPENETVTRVYLNIPFFGSVADGETENNDEGVPVAREYDLDSIYGSQDAEFRLRVEELTYYLRDLDPSSGFRERQEYFSDKDFSAYAGAILCDSVIKIDNREILIYGEEDDPDTEENEEEQVETRLTPRIRVAMDRNMEFFQQILDKEGESELISNNNFREFIRGLRFSASDFSADAMMLLDWNNASIEVEYEYDRVDTSNDNEIVKNSSSFTMSLAAYTINSNTGGRVRRNNVVNTLVNDPYPSEIEGELDTDTNASRIYLKGGAGIMTELHLFDPVGDKTVLEANQDKGWIINEANLTFYVDREKLDALQNVTEPSRIYVYNLENNEVLLDVELDYTSNQDSNLSKQIYGGILEKEDDKGVRYKIRITEHINQILNEGADNVTLGLSVTSNINNVNNVSAGGGENGDTELYVPEASVINPLGTILYGSGDLGEENEDKRLKLEIFYTMVE
ncbi:DUF4270 domain-containing protein [Sinomicrobium kalidii]|uniref:DUF4270 domain-containing protein n=1 Tax=Sinomicrobium kalidii TaxID=2900738 RepID=UPI001E39FDE5|nr:DUF4270 domain-containing protein [Sinomicrobium kalidii]UGU18308.1 DUF4270 domain-containing protein [Sinomicrobium kalidii]